MYRGPKGYITNISDSVKMVDTKIEFQLMDYVLFQHEADEPRSRFIVIGRRFLDAQNVTEYCCRPLGSAEDVRGCVWLPDTAIYHVDLWFRELRIFDPVPVNINYPKPPLRIDTRTFKAILQESSRPKTTAPLMRRAVDSEPFLESVHPGVLGAGIVGLYLVIDQS